MTKQEVATIERIVRQQWLDASDTDERRFHSWIEVDQEQALELIAMIPGVPDCGPVEPLPSPVASSMSRLVDPNRPLSTVSDEIVNAILALTLVAMGHILCRVIFGKWAGWGWTAAWFVSAFCGSLISDFWRRNRRGTR